MSYSAKMNYMEKKEHGVIYWLSLRIIQGKPCNLQCKLYFIEAGLTLVLPRLESNSGWDFIWQRGSAADRNFEKLNRNIGRKPRVFVAFEFINF